MTIALRYPRISHKIIWPFLKMMKQTKRPKEKAIEPPVQIYDPYVYGWRYLKYTDANGQEQYERIPLTIEDVLHPLEDDQRIHAYEHEDICRYLGNVFKKQTRADPHAVVLLDVRTAWYKQDLKPHTPDISVVFNVKEYKNWTTFYEEVEGTRPNLIVEITSPETRHLDLEDKVREYAQAGVEYYFIIDHYQYWGKEYRRLLGYRLVGGAYEVIKANEHGGQWLAPLRVWLAWAGDKLICYDEAGLPMLDYADESVALAEAEEKVRTLEEEVRLLRARLNLS